MISDSQSYQKNRNATKQITKELNLIPLSDTPILDAPGDRRANQNAARRTERQGFVSVTAAEYRMAVMTATNFVHFQELLAKSKLEFKPVVRGKGEIYGSLVRRQGATEWLKTSTLAKDLSWPKVSHRFPDVQENQIAIPSKDQPKIQPATVFDQPAPAAASEYKKPLDLKRVPAPLHKTLDGSHVAQQPLAARLNEYLDGVSARVGEMLPVSESPLVRTGLLVSMILVEAARFTAQTVAALLRFLTHILNFFGVGLRPRAMPKVEQDAVPVTAALEYEPHFLPDEKQLTGMQNVDDKVADVLQDTLEALKTRDLESLPRGVEGRGELIAALESEDEDGGTAGAVVAADMLKPAPAPEALTLFKTNEMLAGLENFIHASAAYQNEFSEQVLPLVRANEKHASALAALEKAEVAHSNFLESKPKLLRRLVPNLDTSVERSAIEESQKELALAKIRFRENVSEKVAVARATSRELLIRLVEPAHAEMLEMVTKLDDQFAAGPMAKAGGFESALKLYVKHGVPSFAQEMRSFAHGFAAELDKARAQQVVAAQALTAQALSEKEAFERAQRERHQRDQGAAPADDSETNKS